jgi:AMP-polyphosphate phosphotransferase
MLEKVDLTLELSKKEYKKRLEQAGTKLTLLQRSSWAAGIPIAILFEGWDASGKGTSINLLAQYLDPRGFRINATTGATSIEKQMPWLWRFWLKLPNYGEFAIFDRSWYGRVMVERVEKLIPPDSWREAYQDILEFERAISEDGYILIKFFMHISKKEQKRRFEEIESDPLQKWRITKEDWSNHKRYKEYLLAIEEMLERTETEWGSWTIIEATNREWARIKVMETVCNRIEEALKQCGQALPVQEESSEVAKEVGEVD